MYHDKLKKYITNNISEIKSRQTIEKMRREFKTMAKDNGDSNTGSMLSELYDHISQQTDRNRMTKSVVLIFTTGYSNDRFIKSAKNLQSLEKLTVGAIGYGSEINKRNLPKIASPSTAMFGTTFSIDSRENLEKLNQQLEKTILLQVCPEEDAARQSRLEQMSEEEYQDLDLYDDDEYSEEIIVDYEVGNEYD